jgi:hypothetical protein
MAHPATRNRDAERRTTRLMQAAVLAWYSPAWPPACACCGTTEDLGIEHVNGDGKAQRETLFGTDSVTGRFYRWLIEHGFPDTLALQVHCRPCNSSKGAGPACRLDHSLSREERRRAALRRTQATWRERHGASRTVSVRPGTVGGRILADLAENGPSQVADLAARLELTPGSAAVSLSGLLKEGHVARPSHGVYGLPGARPARRERVYQPGPDGRAAMNGRDWAAGTTWTTDVTDETGVM